MHNLSAKDLTMPEDEYDRLYAQAKAYLENPIQETDLIGIGDGIVTPSTTVQNLT